MAGESEYGILVKAHADTAGLKKEIQDFSNGIQRDTKINLTVKADEKSIEKLREKTNLISEDFKKIKQDVKTAFNFKYHDENGIDHLYKKVEKVTETFKNSAGEVQKLETIIAHFGARAKVLSSQVVSSTKVFEGWNNTLDQTATKLRTVSKESYTYKNDKGQNVNVETTTNNVGEQVRRVTTEEQKLDGVVRTVTEQIKKQGEGWSNISVISQETISNQINQLQKLGNQFESVRKYKNSLGEEVTVTKTTDFFGNEKIVTARKTLDEFGNSVIKTITGIKELNGKYKILGTTTKKYTDEIKQQAIEQEKLEKAKKEKEDFLNKLVQEKEATRQRNEELRKSITLYEEITKVKDKYGNIVTTTTTRNAFGQEEKTRVYEYENELGQKIQATTRFIKEQNGEWKVVGSTSVKVIDDQIDKEEKEAKALKEVNKVIKEKSTLNNSYKKSVGLVSHEIKQQTIETTDLTGATTIATVTTDSFVDSEGRLVTAMTKVDEQGKKTTETMVQMGQQAKHIGQSFVDILVKVAKFYLASLPVRAVQSAVTEATQSVKDFDSALTEFKKVSDLSGDSLKEYYLNLEQLGTVAGRTRTEMVEMATEFKRSGYSDEDAARLAQMAAIYQNIADEELSASDASAVLISQMKAFQGQGLEAIDVINGINEVANNNAVSSGDIGRGLTQAGAALSTYGNTFYETIGLITAGTEIFQNRSQQVARGLNTVASRIAKNEKALHAYGVEIYDEVGNLRSTYDILKDLSGNGKEVTKSWEEMSKAEQVALGTTLAGVNQYKVFSAVMTNFNTAIKATRDALDSENSAMKENSKYMESIEAKIQLLKSELQKFLLQGDYLQNLFKFVISNATKVIQFINSTQGKIALLGVTVLILINNLEKLRTFLVSAKMFKTFIGFIESAITALTTYILGLKNAGQAVEYFNAELTALELNPITVWLSAITILITALVMITYKANKALEDHQEKLRKASEEMEEASNNIKEYKSRLEEIQKEIEEINNTGLDLDKNSEQNIRKLKEEQYELEKLIALEELKEKKARDKAEKEANKILESSGQKTAFTTTTQRENKMAQISSQGTDEFLVSGGYISKERYESFKSRSDAGGYLNQAESLEVATAKLKAYSDEYDKLLNKYEKSKQEGSGIKWTNEDQKNMEKVKQNLNDATNKATDLASNVQEAYDKLTPNAENYEQIKETLDGFYDTITNFGTATREELGLTTIAEEDLEDETEELDEEFENVAETLKATASEKERAKALLDELGIKENALQKEIGMSSIELVRQADAWNMDANSLYYYLTALKQFDESVDNIQSNYQTLQTAIDEYNEMQGFSIDTMQTLLKMSPEYLQMLDDAINGNKDLKDSITEKIKAQALEAKQVIYNTAIERLNNLITEDNVETDERQWKSYKDTSKAIDEETAALTRNSVEQVKNTVIKNGANKLAAEEIMEDMDRQISIIDKAVLTLGKDFSGAMGKSNSSTKDTNSSLKEQNNLLKEQKQLLEEKKKQYDTVVSYIKKKIQDEIKSIEKEKKAQVDAIKEQIDALKDLKKEELDRIQEQIDALKEQKSVEQEFWQNKIDALKEQNDELNTQLEYEELLENLAKAKSKRVRVYKEGQGFVYTEDTNEVDKAQAKVEEFQRKQTYEEQLKILENYKKQSENNYEDQIKALEKLKDEKEKNYEQQIKDLENYQKQIEDQYDARIAYFQSYLDKFTEQTDAYENEQNRQLAIQLTGIDFEQQGWQTRLDNLANFVEKYNALLGDIHTLDTDNAVVTTTPPTTPPATPPTTPPTASTAPATMTASDLKKAQGGGMPTSDAAKVQTQERKTAEWYAKNYGGKKASGDSSIKEDGLYLVGDSPNQELVIGSKLNGNLMNLTQGSGVVNASSTRTLAGMLNQLGFMGNQGVNMSNSQNKSTNITIGNISLPSVQNGKDFVDYLQNFSLQMTQEAFV